MVVRLHPYSFLINSWYNSRYISIEHILPQCEQIVIHSTWTYCLPLKEKLLFSSTISKVVISTQICSRLGINYACTYLGECKIIIDNNNNYPLCYFLYVDDIWFQVVLLFFIVYIIEGIFIHVTSILSMIIDVIKINIYQSNTLFGCVLLFYWQTHQLVLTMYSR